MAGGDRVDSRSGASVFDVVLVGAGERARAWLETIVRSKRLRLVGQVERNGDALRSGVPVHRSLEEAIQAYPEAGFALALPPRAALAGAVSLSAAGARGVVEAPIHGVLDESEVTAGSDRVRVAHGWVTLPGRQIVEKLVRRLGSGRISIELAGVPESDQGEVDEALIHGLALVRALVPDVAVVAARRVRGQLEIDLAPPGSSRRWLIGVKIISRGCRLAVRVEGASDPMTWTWDGSRSGGTETVMLGSKAVVVARAVPNGAARALTQLVTGTGDSLADAAAATRLSGVVEGLLPSGLPPNGRILRQSASIAERRPSDVLARLGLRGEIPASKAEMPGVLNSSLPPEPFELWAFRAGFKPVVFLTVAPAAVEQTMAWFGDVHCERRERRVSVGAQDRWTDRRDQGEARVELYLSNDRDLAQRAAYLQAEVDPTEAILELGQLVGYPPCCVEAFAEQDDRANNSLNRYASWRRTVASGATLSRPWPWQLNNLHTVVAPFYPCSYRCERALLWANAALAEMAREYPGETERLKQLLSLPVLYFDHDHQLVLDGEVTDRGATYRDVTLSRELLPGFGALATVIGSGDRLVLDDRELVVDRDRRVVARFERTDPALGFLAPFG